MKKVGLVKVVLSKSAQDYDLRYRNGEETEFAIVCHAKNGDRAAFEWVWKKYRCLMVGMIGQYKWYHRLTEGEMESEAVEALIHKLEVFKPEKIKKTPEEWRFKYMLINAAWHCRNRLKTAAKIYNEHEGNEFDETDALPNRVFTKENQNKIIDVNRHLYEEYNPEKIVLESMEETLEEKEKRLMDMLTPLQKTLLQFRQAGLTVQQIADRMGCGFTKVRLQIVQARELAYQIFDVA